jgi:hypothetical protein
MLRHYTLLYEHNKFLKLFWPFCSAIIAIILLFTIAGCSNQAEPIVEMKELLNGQGREEIITEAVAEGTYPIYYVDPEYGTIPLDEVPIGARLIDLSWEWDLRTGVNYTNKAGDYPRHIKWIVVAKDHYEGIEPHITILTEEIIGFFAFDNSSRRADNIWGNNNWGKSGASNATLGIRPWLNSTGIHKGEGFYQACSENFKNNIITTIVPNCDWENGNAYTTEDKVFVPSTTELGDLLHDYTYPIGEIYPYFAQVKDEKRVTIFRGYPNSYLTRSPVTYDTEENIFTVDRDGVFYRHKTTYYGDLGVRPVLNLRNDVLVSELTADAEAKIAIVNADYLRLRSGPGTEYEILDRFMKGQILKILESENGWYLIRLATAKEGWVHGDFVDLLKDLIDKINNQPTGLTYPQPVGYEAENIAKFVENATTFWGTDYLLPEFAHPNDISNDDLIMAMTLNRLIPTYKKYGTIAGEDVQLTAKLIFGPDLKDIEHNHAGGIYDWDENNEEYSISLGAPASYAETKVLKVQETNHEFIVDAVHVFYYFPPDGIEGDTYVAGELFRMEDFDLYDDFYKEALLITNNEEPEDLIKEQPNLFPVRRYVLSKEGDGVCYIRQSYLLD